jgi:hypothetical protein
VSVWLQADGTMNLYLFRQAGLRSDRTRGSYFGRPDLTQPSGPGWAGKAGGSWGVGQMPTTGGRAEVAKQAVFDL